MYKVYLGASIFAWVEKGKLEPYSYAIILGSQMGVSPIRGFVDPHEDLEYFIKAATQMVHRDMPDIGKETLRAKLLALVEEGQRG